MRPIAGLMYVLAVPIWFGAGAPLLPALALGLAAILQARDGRWGRAGALAGCAALLDPSGLLLIGLLLIVALQTEANTRRTLRWALPLSLLALVLAWLVVRPALPSSFAIWIPILPLVLIAPFGWRIAQSDRFAGVVVAWGALDCLARVIAFGGPISPVIVPGLALLAESVNVRRLKPLLTVGMAAILIISLSRFGWRPIAPNFALRLPDELFASGIKPVSIPFGPDLTLIGVQVDPLASPQTRLRLDWQVGTPPTAPLLLKFDVFNHAGQSVGSASASVADWSHGRLTTRHEIALPSLPPGVLNVILTVSYRAARLGQQQIGRVIVPPGSRPFAAAKLATLPGGSVFFKPSLDVQPGALNVNLTWQSAGPLDRDYKVFLHVTDTAQAIPVQADREPQDGNIPTSLWGPGDVIEDLIPLDLSKLAPGDYALSFGMYAGDQRLPLRDCANQTVDSIRLAVIHVGPSGAISVTDSPPGC